MSTCMCSTNKPIYIDSCFNYCQLDISSMQSTYVPAAVKTSRVEGVRVVGRCYFLTGQEVWIKRIMNTLHISYQLGDLGLAVEYSSEVENFWYIHVIVQGLNDKNKWWHIIKYIKMWLDNRIRKMKNGKRLKKSQQMPKTWKFKKSQKSFKGNNHSIPVCTKAKIQSTWGAMLSTR